MSAAAPVMAQDADRAAAEDAVETYFRAHNAHDLATIAALYREDATFQLSGGRELVVGREDVLELERFDVLAKSRIHPRGSALRRVGDAWHFDIADAIEHSEIFEAFGLSIVRTQPKQSVLVLRDGRIMAVNQPELHPACLTVMLDGFGAFAGWMTRTGDAQRADLLADGRVKLETATVVPFLSAVRRFRSSSEWTPDYSSVRDCAGGDF